MKKNLKIIKIIIIIFFWLVIWQIAACVVSSKLLLAGPIDTLGALWKLFFNKNTYSIIGSSVQRIFCGFLLALVLALALGIVSDINKLIRDFLEPVVMLIKAVPVASLVILALIWMKSKNLSVLIVFLIAFPIIYNSVLLGLSKVSKDELLIAKCYRLGIFKSIKAVYLPSLREGMEGTLKLCIAISFKAGVAAEVISQPVSSIGEQLYLNKLYLDTDVLFAWTLIIVLLAYLFEKLTGGLFCLLFSVICMDDKVCGQSGTPETVTGDNRLLVQDLYYRVNDRELFNGLSFEADGELLVIKGESGDGKSTLVDLLIGNKRPLKGRIEMNFPCALVTQKTVLFENYNAISNVSFCMKNVPKNRGYIARQMLLELLDESALNRPVATLSGGEKRRVEIVRALSSRIGTVILDEPFKGLDEINRDKAFEFIKKNSQGKTVIITLHEFEAENTRIINLKN